MISAELKTVFVECAPGTTEAERIRTEGLVEAKLQGWRCIALANGSQLARTEAVVTPKHAGGPVALADLEIKLKKEIAEAQASGMPHIKVHRYEQVTEGHVGYVAPDDGSWILFIHRDGTPWFCPDNLTVLGHDGFKPAGASPEDDLTSVVKQCLSWPDPVDGETRAEAAERRTRYLLSEVERLLDASGNGWPQSPVGLAVLEALRGSLRSQDILIGPDWTARVHSAEAIRVTVPADGRTTNAKVEALVSGGWVGVEVGDLRIHGEAQHNWICAKLRIDGQVAAIGTCPPEAHNYLW